ncbi:pyridoxal 5'-phosphate synthase glutaminase subunit PdxT [Listeria aquatica]|uniref:Pyridoxal 5'-phosphate synthase subunit PdxT n=1 Tax=Listeria aquatica FSL S10-1188 TaxID=1265818 RepID=W7BP78_9LIST|nr:pyridoxal 5'-phosphate synthase glutaminase subunit PdxT [Listeria aquatica]EUJ21848.1 glutamine amidotransferase subunit PdxT [Listeria aquatica FSL S10-1188]
MNAKKIGVLALQGAVSEHLVAIQKLGATPVSVKRPEQLEALDGLILPGGESTTMRRLMKRFGLFEPLRTFHQAGKGILGTCAGMVLAARETDSGEESLSLIDAKVIRNGFGRQKESFEAPLAIEGISGGPFQAVFIRAPYLEQLGKKPEVLARIDEKIVAARQENVLVAAFHPELTDDLRLLEYFIRECI